MRNTSATKPQKQRFKKHGAKNSAPERSNAKGFGPRKMAPKKSAKGSSITDLSLLEKKAISPVEESKYRGMKVADLKIDQRLKANLLKKGYEALTEIQDKTFDSLMEKKDILGIAQTGTGKTAAFLVPIINEYLKNPKSRDKVLILVPTRELAVQIEQEFRSMTKGLKVFCASFIGGTNINTDIQRLNKNPHVVIGTPGRILDLYQRRDLKLAQYQTLILDEFDRMLDMGFIKDIQFIISQMKQRNHNLLFSATLDNAQKPIIDEILTDPVFVKTSSGKTSSQNVNQRVIKLKDGDDKFEILCRLLELEEMERVIIFEETKHQVKRLCRRLDQLQINNEEIHGNKSQSARQKALDNFKEGKSKILVATDVAARGIDVNNVSHVINYQLPKTYDTYIHRIGRTGRAGKSGHAITIV